MTDTVKRGGKVDTQRTFRCDHCHGVFEPEWSEAEAQAEYAETFSEEVRAKSPRPAVLCDVCYQSFKQWANSGGWV